MADFICQRWPTTQSSIPHWFCQYDLDTSCQEVEFNCPPLNPGQLLWLTFIFLKIMWQKCHSVISKPSQGEALQLLPQSQGTPSLHMSPLRSSCHTEKPSPYEEATRRHSGNRLSLRITQPSHQTCKWRAQLHRASTLSHSTLLSFEHFQMRTQTFWSKDKSSALVLSEFLTHKIHEQNKVAVIWHPKFGWYGTQQWKAERMELELR